MTQIIGSIFATGTVIGDARTTASSITTAYNDCKITIGDYVLKILPEDGGCRIIVIRGSEKQEAFINDGRPVTHSWNGTALSITSASGTSSSDLKGERGDPGFSPIISISEIAGGHRLTIVDVDGEQTIDVMNGFSTLSASDDGNGNVTLSLT